LGRFCHAEYRETGSAGEQAKQVKQASHAREDRMTASMRVVLALLVLVASSVSSLAGEIRKGATMQVKPNSIWFEDSALLTKWQQLKKSGDAAALASYQEQVLSQRDAWQFINQLTVKVLSHKPKQSQVNVEMQGPGRLVGTKWFLDAGALVD
jgi:hypothetical protein